MSDQVQITGAAELGGMFHVFVDGVEVSKHTTERKAEIAATNEQLKNLDSEVYYEHRYRVMIGSSVVAAAGGSGVRRATVTVNNETNTAPSAPTVSVNEGSTTAGLTGSAFSDVDPGDTHAETDWQVTTTADTGFASPVFQSLGNTTNKTAITATGLTISTGYIARARYRDSAGNWSNWSASASFTTTDGTGASPFFTDDFETGDLSHAEGGFSWGSTNNVTVEDMNADVGVSPPTGTYAARFRFPGVADGVDSWSELRFNHGDLTEAWYEYDCYIPASYEHRDSTGADNNKFFRVHASDADFHITTELVRNGAAVDESGMKRFLTHTDGELGTITHCCADQEPYKSARLSTSDVVGPDGTFFIQTGQWVQLRFHFRSASTRSTQDGVAEWFADGTLVKRLLWDFWTNDGGDGGNPGQQAYANGGYVWGWANSGFDSETKIWVKNFKVYSSSPGWGHTV
jgi:hypothetical protein